MGAADRPGTASVEADARRKPRVVFLGPPNSGKGTQAVRLAEALGVPAISTGDMLRRAVAEGSDLGKTVDAVMASGALVSDELMAEVVRERLRKDDATEGFLLDGYPRTAPQAETLVEILKSSEVDLDHVVLLDCPREVLVARALERGRPDDQPEIVAKRLDVYADETSPLVEYYDGLGLLRRVDGNHSIDDVAAAILEAVGG